MSPFKDSALVKDGDVKDRVYPGEAVDIVIPGSEGTESRVWKSIEILPRIYICPERALMPLIGDTTWLIGDEADKRVLAERRQYIKTVKGLVKHALKNSYSARVLFTVLSGVKPLPDVEHADLDYFKGHFEVQIETTEALYANVVIRAPELRGENGWQRRSPRYGLALPGQGGDILFDPEYAMVTASSGEVIHPALSLLEECTLACRALAGNAPPGLISEYTHRAPEPNELPGLVDAARAAAIGDLEWFKHIGGPDGVSEGCRKLQSELTKVQDVYEQAVVEVDLNKKLSKDNYKRLSKRIEFYRTFLQHDNQLNVTRYADELKFPAQYNAQDISGGRRVVINTPISPEHGLGNANLYTQKEIEEPPCYE
ncbi:hypothetical protein ACIQ9Q_43225 [Streptomyces sp. NPDC094438]|uniref:hypothetical protein n=1 Tax=Streptomyces sp. NPDC094438 TaxID=3366061 RepID=UPI00382603B2